MMRGCVYILGAASSFDWFWHYGICGAMRKNNTGGWIELKETYDRASTKVAEIRSGDGSAKGLRLLTVLSK